MTKTEFIVRLKNTAEQLITDNMYKDIEFVYTWHPCLDNVAGKDQIAKLFDMFGYRVIKDMLLTAQKAKELCDEITKRKVSYRNLDGNLTSLKGNGCDRTRNF